MKDVTVIVAGRFGQGKTTIAKLIEQALKAKGVDVRMFDRMNDVNEDLEKAVVNPKAEQTSVMIKTVTTSRTLEMIED